MTRNIKTVGIIGAGNMGAGIAVVCLANGYNVYISDASADALSRSKETIQDNLMRFYRKAGIVEDALEVMRKRMKGWSVDICNMAKCDLVIEAIKEKSEAKIALFKELDEICPPKTIFASNTSAIPIYWMGGFVSRGRARNIVGLHFMNPPAVHKRLELIKSMYTSKAAYAKVRAFAKSIGRDPIMEVGDTPGFVINYVLAPAINAAARLVERGEKPEDVNAVVAGVDASMPILDLADYIGLDIVLDILYVLQKSPDSWQQPSTLLSEMVRRGNLGRKTGEGFFRYDERGKKIEGGA